MNKVSKDSVDYRNSPSTNNKRCGNCVMFHSQSKACDLVNGIIESSHVCDRWENKPRSS